MPKSAVSDWSTTAADNTDVGGISLAEGVMVPSAVNNSFREMMAQIATAGFVGAATTVTLTNKSLSDSTTFIVDNSDATKKAQFQASGITTATTRTYTFPDATGTLALSNAAQTISGVYTFSAIPVLSGGAISFPATQVASADANTLDDYEEGTWTPAFSATGCTFSYSSQVGTYTKIGNRVMIEFAITLNTSGNTLAANALSITGFPFANGNGAAAAAQLFWSSSTSSYVHMSGLINNGASTLSVSGLTAAFTSANLAANASQALHATNGSSIRGTISYKV